MSWNGTAPVQSTSSHGSGSTFTLAYTGNVTSGNLLLAEVACAGGTPTSVTISDNQGNTWARVVASGKNSGNTFAELWWAVASGTNTPTITVTPSPAAAPSYALALSEYQPAVGGSTIALDGSIGAKANSGTNPSAGTIPVNGSNELVVAFFGANAGIAAPTAGTNYVIDQTILTAVSIATEYDMSASSAQTGNFTESTSTAWAACGASFSATAGSTTWTVNASDNLAFNGTVSRLSNAFRLASDNLAVTDAASRLSNAFRALSDNIALTDQISRLANAFRTVSDNVALSDSAQRVANALRLLSDNLAITDAATLVKHGAGVWTIAVADNIGVTDSFARLASARRSLSDNIGLSDTIARQVAYLRALADNLALTDTASTSTNRSALTIQVADNLAASDAAKRAAACLRLLADNLAAADLFVRQAAYGRSVADNLGATDNVQRLANAFRVLADNFGVTDSAVVSAITAVVLTRIINLSGSWEPTRNLTGGI